MIVIIKGEVITLPNYLPDMVQNNIKYLRQDWTSKILKCNKTTLLSAKPKWYNFLDCCFAPIQLVGVVLLQSR